MHVVITVIAVVIVIAGIYFSQRNFGKTDSQTNEDQEVLSEETIQEEESTPTPVPNTPTNTSTPTITRTEIHDYRYPNSTVISSLNNSLLLTSSDDADKITSWYKEKINSQGMNVKTFVTTKTNDNVLNKLVGADSDMEVRVEITKDSGSSSVNISISLK
ncbi:hypothetical protein IID22_05275 [Patescibacteria group bacterium]|nr:hypothetical protein [Patescibacteria group bacterium]